MISATSFYWAPLKGFEYDTSAPESDPDIVFYFFDKKISQEINVYEILKNRFPKSLLFGCSSSGPILSDDIYPDTFTGLTMSFEKTTLKVAQLPCSDPADSYKMGEQLVQNLLGEGLTHIFTITDGMTIHGTEFIQGANSVLPPGVGITGGMSSDGFEFRQTLTGINSPPMPGQVCAVGFYSTDLTIGFGADGGWDKFGIERVVTKSDGNILYELDGRPALDLYKEYLGEDAKNLPGNCLLFPLSIRMNDNSDSYVRTIDVVDEKTKALRFTGDIPEGYIAQFMKGEFSHLVTGAQNAAKSAKDATDNGNRNGKNKSAALIVSCLGRQLLMGQQISDELEAVMQILGEMPAAGFYSNGEFSYNGKNEFCILHNQTMTLTILHEA